MSTNKVFISICADDFGITEKVSTSILELAEKKRITATSCLVNSSDFNKVYSKIKKFKKTLDIGLHLDFTFNPTFKNNFFVNIKKEINIQFNKFEKKMGFLPDFIDGHHHVHQLPFIRNVLIKIIKKRYKNKNPWIRITSDEYKNIFLRNESLMKSLFLTLLGNSFKKIAIKNNLRFNERFSGIYNFKTTNYKKKFEKFLLNIKNGHLIMVHPGVSDKKLVSLDEVTLAREKELKFLKSNQFKKILKSKNIKLIKLSKYLKSFNRN